MSARTRRIRKHRAAVRRANHRAVSEFGPCVWAGDALVVNSYSFGYVWVRDYIAGRPGRCGFVLGCKGRV